VKLKIDKTLVASVALHVLVIGWGLVSFSSKAFESTEIEAVPVEFVTDDQLSKITAGIKSGKKENPKPLVEKVAEAKPMDDAVGKITEKKAIVTDAAPDPTPKPAEKPVEKKPDPPKPVAETKPKDEPKPIEKKPDPPKVDPIAEALKKEEVKKPAPKPEAKAAPTPPVKKREYKFDTETIAALVDKRDPSRQAFAGETLNSSPAVGTAKGTAATLSASYLSALVSQIHDCWQRDAGGFDEEEIKIPITLAFKVDGTLSAAPLIEIEPRTPRERAIFEGARRAIISCQPFKMLPQAKYAEWKTLPFMFHNKAY
jgi:outer membrane biosynthesis protein TonB